MAKNEIVIKGAREHNLKNIDVTIPRDKLVVMTGLSGSGKSSLAFDTIYADGQRRYVESLSSYARMFLGQMDKPDVDSIEGLSPAISIDQKTTSKNPRSTVGTVTEIYDYLRLLYARIGIPHCPVCGREIKHQTIDQIVDKIMSLEQGTKIQVLAPIVRGRKGEHTKELERCMKSGFVRARVDGITYDLSEEIKIDKNKKHNIEIIVDRLVIKDSIKSRLTDSLETVCSMTGGTVIIDVIGGNEEMFSQNYACPEHGVSMDDLTPRMFSFNNPFGACPKCTGLGVFKKINPDLIIPNKDLSIRQGAIKASGWNSLDDKSITMMYYEAISKQYGISLDVPVKELPQDAVDIFLYGTQGQKLKLSRGTSSFYTASYEGAFEGIIPNLERRYKESASEYSRADIETVMTDEPCPECHGQRLKKESLSVTVGGLNIHELTQLSVVKALEFFENVQLTKREALIGERIIKEIKDRLRFLSSVGLEYLTLSRSSGTLSGGESQRIRLATQIGSSLVGVLYILDEPSIGLHSIFDKGDAPDAVLSVSGGTVLAVGSAEKAKNFKAGTQYSRLEPVSGHAGDVISTDDGSGVTLTAAKDFGCVIYSSPSFTAGSRILVSAQAETEGPAEAKPEWDTSVPAEITDEVRTLFDEAMKGLLGVHYEPLAVLAQQGETVCILCRASAVVPDAKPTYALVYLSTENGSPTCEQISELPLDLAA